MWRLIHRTLLARWLLVVVGVMLSGCGGKAVSNDSRPVPSQQAGSSGLGDGGEPASVVKPPPPWECIGYYDCAPGEGCLLGRCRELYDCGDKFPRCGADPPACPPGQAASLVDGCWGACVPVTSCGLDTCEPCDRLGLQCATYGEGVVYSCVEKPQGCDPLTCECGGDEVCGPLDCLRVLDGVVECRVSGVYRGQCCDHRYTPECDLYEVPDPPGGCDQHFPSW